MARDRELKNKMMMRLSFLFLLLLFLSPVFGQTRAALIISVGEQSAGEVGQVTDSLEARGFNVYAINNPGAEKARAIVDQFYRLLRQRTQTALVYFIGPVTAHAGEMYLFPEPVSSLRPEFLPIYSLPLKRVMNRMQEAKVPERMIILDSSRALAQALSAEQIPPVQSSLFAYAPPASFVKNASMSERLAAGLLEEKGSFQSLLTNLKKEDSALIVRGELTAPISVEASLDKRVRRKMRNLDLFSTERLRNSFKLKDGEVVTHTEIVNEVKARKKSGESRTYITQLGEETGVSALEFCERDFLRGTFFVLQSGKQIQVYGRAYQEDQFLLSLWESGTPFAWGSISLFPEAVADETWLGEMSSEVKLILQRKLPEAQDDRDETYLYDDGERSAEVEFAWSLSGKGMGSSQSLGFSLRAEQPLPDFLLLEIRNQKGGLERAFLETETKGDLSFWKGTLQRMNGSRSDVSLKALER